MGALMAYTLVELLVSLVILGTLVGGLGLALSTGLDADERARREGERAQEIRIIINAARRYSARGADARIRTVVADRQRRERRGTQHRYAAADDAQSSVSLSRLEQLESSSPSWRTTRPTRIGRRSPIPAPVEADGSLGLFRREQTPPGIDPRMSWARRNFFRRR